MDGQNQNTTPVQQEKKANVPSLYARLATARAKLNEKVFSKGGVNQYNQQKYFELSDFLPYINDICADLMLLPVVTFDMNGEDKMAYMDIIDGDVDSPTSEKSIRFNMPLADVSLQQKNSQKIQELGAMQTYAIRYLYMNAFAISERDVLDATYSSFSKEQLALVKILQDAGSSIEAVAKSYGTPISDLTAAQLRDAAQRKLTKTMGKEEAEKMLEAIPSEASSTASPSGFRDKVKKANETEDGSSSKVS